MADGVQVSRALVGISGWVYPAWRKTFYPPGLTHRQELAYAASRLTSIEINGSFYALQRPSSYQRWHDETPDNFVFAVKGPRYITHLKRLGGVETPLANFFASGVLALDRKLGPILWQLPPNFRFDQERLASFFALLPRTTAAAGRLAEGRDETVPDDRAFVSPGHDLEIRHAVEVRHASMAEPRALALMRDHDVAVVLADSAGKWPRVEQPAPDFAYLRLHGADELYVSGYTASALDDWAQRVRTLLATGRDVYVYFDNDAKVRAPYDAMGLIERINHD